MSHRLGCLQEQSVQDHTAREVAEQQLQQLQKEAAHTKTSMQALEQRCCTAESRAAELHAQLQEAQDAGKVRAWSVNLPNPVRAATDAINCTS